MPLATEEAIRRAAAMIAVPVGKVTALALTYHEASKDYTLWERMNAANAVLFFKGSSDGHDPRIGHFERLLLLAWQSADEANRDRLAIAFPAMADAWDIYQQGGARDLQKWVDGTFGKEE